ncbi:MAG: hypothetical protein ACRC6A_09365 [Fusobacteriaceae bacterium]
MLDIKQVAKINRLADLLKEIKSPNMEREYKCSYELARKVFLQELEELEKEIEVMKDVHSVY